MSDSKRHPGRDELMAELEAIVMLEPRAVPFGDVQEIMRDRAHLRHRAEAAEAAHKRLEEQLEAAREDAYREHQAVEGWSLKAERLQEQLEAMREVAGDYVYREYVERLEEQLEALCVAAENSLPLLPEHDDHNQRPLRALLASNPAKRPS